MRTGPDKRPLPGTACLWAARAVTTIWPFRTLRLATYLFEAVPSPSILERELFGLRFACDVSRSNAQRLVYLLGESFLPERTLLRPLLRAGAHVVDVGANVGYYLALWERYVGPSGFIDCIEPEPDNLEELRHNVNRNRLDNVRIASVAAGGEDGSGYLRPGINGTLVEPEEGVLSVPIRRLDSLIDGRVDLLKIDVEGYEGEVLKGAEGLLTRDRPALFIEVHPWLLQSGHTVASLLHSVGGLYGQIEAWEAFEGSFVRKALARYGLRRGVRRLPGFDPRVLDKWEGRRTPFWLVCRP